MKNIFLIIGFIVTFSMYSCEFEEIVSKREPSQFTKQDSAWIPPKKDTLIYTSNLGREVVFTLYDYQAFNEFTGKKPRIMAIDYNSNSSKLNRIYIYLTRHGNGEESNGSIGYSFSMLNQDNLIPITDQPMGLIDTDTNQPINAHQVNNVYLGTHELNEKVYTDVFSIEDINERNVPQIDISRFYVNPSGILRIEFYDGEIWDRVE